MCVEFSGGWETRPQIVYFILACESFSPPHLCLKISEKDLISIWIMCHMISELVAS